MARKKQRSIKQKAAIKRLISFNKNKRRRVTKTINAAKKPRNSNMAKRKGSRRFSRVSSGFKRAGAARGKFGSILKHGLIGDTVSALGAGMLVGAVTDRAMPSITPYATLGAEYLSGGIGGMVLAEGLKSFTGQPSVLSGLLSGIGIGGNSGQMQQVVAV